RQRHPVGEAGQDRRTWRVGRPLRQPLACLGQQGVVSTGLQGGTQGGEFLLPVVQVVGGGQQQLPAFQYTAVGRLGGVVSRVFFMRGLPATGLGGDGGAQAAQVAVEHLGGQFAVQREQAVDGGLLFATQGFAAGLFRLRLFARGQHGIAAGGLFVEAALFFTAGALAGLLPLLAQLRQAGAVEVVHRAAGVLGDFG